MCAVRSAASRRRFISNLKTICTRGWRHCWPRPRAFRGAFGRFRRFRPFPVLSIFQKRCRGFFFSFFPAIVLAPSPRPCIADKLNSHAFSNEVRSVKVSRAAGPLGPGPLEQVEQIGPRLEIYGNLIILCSVITHAPFFCEDSARSFLESF